MLYDLVTIGGGKKIHPGAYLIDEILQNATIVLAFVALAALLLKNKGRTGFGIAWAGIDRKYRSLMPNAGLGDRQIEASLAAIHDFRRIAHVSGLTSLLHS